MTRTTPELAPPLQASTPHENHFVLIITKDLDSCSILYLTEVPVKTLLGSTQIMTPNNTIKDKINYLMDNFFLSPSPEHNLDYTPIIGHVEPMVLVDIEIVINALKGGKAPGLDRIDFRM
ncbi:hypothetical protein AVEN_187111-1 [Araneus ventricosus]|uniref:Uncharacterized protein n=1 Tax=Araneus ventricosus TaxID=182803 RepID=A0A4Y2EVN3_ARAVE|nr:hypothetical protein AVEN_187111-1 [Araneus ventricosus]